MKALAFIAENNDDKLQWIFDRVIAMLAYDIEIQVVFIHMGCQQLSHFKAWKSLAIYGVDRVFVLEDNLPLVDESLIKFTAISKQKLQQLIQHVDIII